MKLQILIPHYRESAETIRPLLDSIAIQQNVDFSEIGVIICHDGEDISYFRSGRAWAVPELDLIISGHTHTDLAEPIQCGRTYIVSV